MTEPRVVIIGAGPAGIAAAGTLARANLRPVVVDEAAQAGGKIYARPPGAIKLDYKTLYGVDAGRALHNHRSFDQLREHMDYRPDSLVWTVEAGHLHILSKAGPKKLAWDRLIIATGAMDRIIPFPGWTLPGVFTLGGAQHTLKLQACAIGRRPLFIGTGPLLYLVAYQYVRAGIKPAAVLDTTAASTTRRALPWLLCGGRTLLKGLSYIAWLRLQRVRLVSGVRPVKACPGPDGAISHLVWRDGRGREHSSECDALAMGFGLRSETRLADLCGAPFAMEPIQRQWLPIQDEYGRAGLPGIYLAGDGMLVRGAEAAEISGARAANAVLHDLGHVASEPLLKTLNRKLAVLGRFQRALHEKAFPFPDDLAGTAADDLVICRCEGITAGELRRAVSIFGVREINRAKAFTRIGMGRCQGRVCEATAAEILANELNVPLEKVERLRSQAPVKPLPIAEMLKGKLS